MNGAESLIRTAAQAGADVIFANPGTSELELVAAIDRVPRMRAVLALFEGVCTGAADGYARMSGRPGLTLLHLGCGLGNGFANLHNARRARAPIVNLVGDHASYHLKYDAPLTSDIACLAGVVSPWQRTSASARTLAQDFADALAAAQSPPGQVATLIIPSECSWDEADGPVQVAAAPPPRPVEPTRVERTAKSLRSSNGSAILLGDRGCSERGQRAAARVAAAVGCRLFYETFPRRIERGAGLPAVRRLPYFPEDTLKALEGARTLVLAGAKAPVAFFAYRGLPSLLMPEGCEALELAQPGEDIEQALEDLASELDAAAGAGEMAPASRPPSPTGRLDTKGVGLALAALLPEGAIISEEALTSGGPAYFLTQNSPPHSVIYLTGGSIGQGIPAATGAAVACPDRRVIALQADGAGMYTLQGLWTQAREGLNVTTIVFSNRAYQILRVELARCGLTERGPRAEALTDLGHPDLDWVALARGLGVPATRPDSAEAFHADLARALAEPGPRLIEVVLHGP